VLIAASSLSAFGRATSGDYALVIGLNAPAAQPGEIQPAGAPIAERISSPWGASTSVEAATGTLTAATPKVDFVLADIDAGQTVTAYVEATSGNLIPMLILRDYGGKALEAGNLGGKQPQATIQYTTTESAVGYSLDVQAAKGSDGAVSEGNYRLLVGVNAPGVLTG
jgi:hypothetical protein